MKDAIVDATPLELAACRLLIAAMRANARSSACVRFDYQYINTRVGALIYTRIDHTDLRGAPLMLSTTRHDIAAIDARRAQIEQLTPTEEHAP